MLGLYVNVAPILKASIIIDKCISMFFLIFLFFNMEILEIFLKSLILSQAHICIAVCTWNATCILHSEGYM